MSTTHCFKAFTVDSNYLSGDEVQVLEQEMGEVIVKVKEVVYHPKIKVAGKMVSKNIAYFHDNIKPLVLNKVNTKVIQKIMDGNSRLEDWKDFNLQLYYDPSVKFGSESVGGIRIKKDQPKSYSKEEVIEIINSATTTTELTSIRNWVKKYGLNEMAKEKFSNLKSNTNV